MARMQERDLLLRDFFNLFDLEEEDDDTHASIETLMTIQDPRNQRIIWSVHVTRVDVATQTEPETEREGEREATEAITERESEEQAHMTESETESEENPILAGAIYYADDYVVPGNWHHPDEDEDIDNIFYPGMATPPSPLSTSSDSGTDEPAVTIQELEAERGEELANELREWLNNYTA